MFLLKPVRYIKCALGLHRNNYQAVVNNKSNAVRYCPDCKKEIFLGLAYSVETDGSKHGLGHIPLLETQGYKVVGKRTPSPNNF